MIVNWDRNIALFQTIRADDLALLGFENLQSELDNRNRDFPGIEQRLLRAETDEPWQPHFDFEPGSPEWQENLDYFQQPLEPWQEALVEELHPSLQAQARAMINHGQYEDINVHPDLVYRSPEDQDAEYARGRSEDGEEIGPTVTDARGGQSAHQYGLAMDIRIYDDFGVSNWDYYRNPDWARMVEIGESYGFYPGAYFPWDDPDFPHFEIPGFDHLDYLGSDPIYPHYENPGFDYRQYLER